MRELTEVKRFMLKIMLMTFALNDECDACLQNFNIKINFDKFWKLNVSRTFLHYSECEEAIKRKYKVLLLKKEKLFL